ncbi:unnamed protein product [Plutella xylostella]|uniref:(diamondback moth) hypothetical protein n=1 Tax=Plutella xylostella TaxID=51655 RepID=A0A8S4G1T3_PLUXY|nr:unnamed protein product [Plutella xylostella]
MVCLTLPVGASPRRIAAVVQSACQRQAQKNHEDASFWERESLTLVLCQVGPLPGKG